MVSKENLAAGKRNPANAERKGETDVQKVMTIVAVVAVIALAVLNLTYTGIEPDEVYPMANTRIEWTYAGK